LRTPGFVLCRSFFYAEVDLLVPVVILEPSVFVEDEGAGAGAVAEVIRDEGVAAIEPVGPDFAARGVAFAVRLTIHVVDLALAHPDAGLASERLFGVAASVGFVFAAGALSVGGAGGALARGFVGGAGGEQQACCDERAEVLEFHNSLEKSAASGYVRSLGSKPRVLTVR
jgi:hypothetical protein